MRNTLLRIGLPALFMLTAMTAANGGGTDPKYDSASNQVTGTVTYRERIALPADAELEVQLLDVSLMDVAAKLISEQKFKPGHAVPIAFALPYDPRDIDARMTYAVRATIRHDGQLLFVTDRSYTVLTRGKPDRVDLVLVQP